MKRNEMKRKENFRLQLNHQNDVKLGKQNRRTRKWKELNL